MPTCPCAMHPPHPRGTQLNSITYVPAEHFPLATWLSAYVLADSRSDLALVLAKHRYSNVICPFIGVGLTVDATQPSRVALSRAELGCALYRIRTYSRRSLFPRVSDGGQSRSVGSLSPGAGKQRDLSACISMQISQVVSSENARQDVKCTG
ncbi:hypothetical protein BDV95DRAFT_58846 [Massariosphaeria phaeospora]|uniref:Uncharacterized protein n=1 Tax=Massariosphaeria phaeospora TaxID=100035 RepID=A0A7C8I5E5_9PLEO|nr:hypothetical protein BDV95DRAFT_58846 [Massariosphaeria phaeospora]